MSYAMNFRRPPPEVARMATPQVSAMFVGDPAAGHRERISACRVGDALNWARPVKMSELLSNSSRNITTKVHTYVLRELCGEFYFVHSSLKKHEWMHEALRVYGTRVRRKL